MLKVDSFAPRRRRPERAARSGCGLRAQHDLARAIVFEPSRTVSVAFWPEYPYCVRLTVVHARIAAALAGSAHVFNLHVVRDLFLAEADGVAPAGGDCATPRERPGRWSIRPARRYLSSPSLSSSTAPTGRSVVSAASCFSPSLRCVAGFHWSNRPRLIGAAQPGANLVNARLESPLKPRSTPC